MNGSYFHTRRWREANGYADSPEGMVVTLYWIPPAWDDGVIKEEFYPESITGWFIANDAKDKHVDKVIAKMQKEIDEHQELLTRKAKLMSEYYRFPVPQRSLSEFTGRRRKDDQ